MSDKICVLDAGESGGGAAGDQGSHSDFMQSFRFHVFIQVEFDELVCALDAGERGGGAAGDQGREAEERLPHVVIP